MEYSIIRIKIKKEQFNQIQQISSLLKKRGWRPKGGLSVQDMFFSSILKNLNSSFTDKFIEENTPVEFLVKEALKDSSMRDKINQFLKSSKKDKRGKNESYHER